MATPGGTRIPQRELVGIAVFCASWCLLFLLGGPAPAFFAVPLVLIGVLVLRDHPVVGALVVLGASLVTLVAGVPYGGVDMMAAFAFALFSVGRMVRSRLVGLAIAMLAATTTALRLPFEPLDLVINAAVCGSMWLFGVTVRRRARSAWTAVANLERLVAEDPRVFTAAHLAAERRRLATDALVALRIAVTDMRDAALVAVRDDDVQPAARIQARGTEAVAELRALLGLLREPESTEPSDALATPRWSDRLTTSPFSAWWLGAYTLATAGTAVGLVRPPEDPEVLLPLAVLYAVVSWRMVTWASVRAWWLLGSLMVLAAALGSRSGPQALGFLFVVFAMSLLAGRTWGERDRIMNHALGESRVMRRRRDAEAAEVLRVERLRVARELHDVTSHAVGVMVLQASAAQALADKDPRGARAALAQVRTAGDDALLEIDQLLDVVDAEGPDGRDLGDALMQLGSRMREAGVSVEVRLLELPLGDEADTSRVSTIHRVVQEALTNVMRHAPGARVLVEVDKDDDAWLVRVADDGARPGGSPWPSLPKGGGHGLTGLAERVTARGGTFSAGPRPSRGYLVEVRLPAH